MTVIFKDTFTDPNGTDLINHTPDISNNGSKWTVNSGSIGITSDTAYQLISGDQFATNDQGISDGKVTYTHAVYHMWSKLIWRYTDSNNYFRVEGSSIYKKVGGTQTTLGSLGTTPINGDIISVSFSGNTHTVYLNGTQVASFTDTFNQTVTKHGIGISASAARIDNFQLESLSTSGTTYIGSGTSQGTSSVASNETLILSGSGQSNGQSTLTDTNKETLSALGMSNGVTSLNTSETVINHTGTTYSESGQSNGIANLTTSESYVYKANGISNGISNVSSNDSVISKANSSAIQGNSSLSTSETIITHTGTTYSASGQSKGISDVSVHETYIGNVSGEVQSSSSLTNNVSQISEEVSQINGSSSLTTTEQFVGHATTTYSASGNSQGNSTSSSTERIVYKINVISNGQSTSQSTETIIYYVTGFSDGYSSLTTLDKFISQLQIIGTIEIVGKHELNIYLNGTRILDLNLKGVV